MHKTTKKDEITCIQLSKKTRDRLAEIGGKDDTFESIIKNLMGESGADAPPERESESPTDE